MSTLATARAELADALNNVDGVKYYPETPSTPKVGDAWVRWQAARDEDSGGFNVTWFIAIVTPQDEPTADAWIDARLDDLLDRLRRVVYVTGYTPADLGPEANRKVGLLITSNRE